jgi:hypothetical protein
MINNSSSLIRKALIYANKTFYLKSLNLLSRHNHLQVHFILSFHKPCFRKSCSNLPITNIGTFQIWITGTMSCTTFWLKTLLIFLNTLFNLLVTILTAISRYYRLINNKTLLKSNSDPLSLKTKNNKLIFMKTINCVFQQLMIINLSTFRFWIIKNFDLNVKIRSL